jgi:nuclear pore complex protein Nup133
VSKLPALPDQLRNNAQSKTDPFSFSTRNPLLSYSQARQHGAIYSSTGYALTLTHTHALVWPYTATNPSPETFTFALPYPSKHQSEPLPLGALVPPTTSHDEPGLVVVMPVSGKISYWESISSAATLDFIRQQRSGVDGSISGMWSNEYVARIVNAESAGFILVFNTGRMAYMSLRDAHGRPNIAVQILRGNAAGGSFGLLGSLRHALTSSATRGEIAAARTSQGPNVGERVVVAVTTKGRLHSWRIHRGGHHELLDDTDIRDQLARAVRGSDRASCHLPEESFEVHDLAFVPRGLEEKYINASRLSEALADDENTLQHALLLVSFSKGRLARYSLVEVVVSPEGPRVGVVRPLTSYTSPPRQDAPEKPRLYLPRPALVAFIVFDRAVVVASMAAPPDSPDSQLQGDSCILPPTFEDVVDFRDDDDNLQIVGSGVEEPTGAGQSQDDARPHRHRTKNPTAVLLLQGVGTVRIAITDIERFASDAPPEVTAKNKLEQAVFFGVKPDNPLVFQGRRDLPFSAQEICNAAIELSHEIVASKTPYIPNVPASLEHNMKSRIAHLDGLMAVLNELNVTLDERTRWVLLYNAEKMAVATWIWQKHEQFLAERPKNDKKTIVAETAVYINEQQKTELNYAMGQVDPVRHWFINDVWRLEIFVAWAYQIVKIFYKENLTDEAGLNRLLWEAVTLSNGALFEARQFRRARAHKYGVDPSRIPGGNAIPDPWTSSYFITTNVGRLIDFCYSWLEKNAKTKSADPRLAESIRVLLPSLTDQYLTSLIEYFHWASHSEDREVLERGQVYHKTFEKDVKERILRLKDFNLWEEAVNLAKEYKEFHTLAELIVQQIANLEATCKDDSATESEVQEAKTLQAVKEQQMGRLFDEYEEQFAFKAYEVLLRLSGIQAVLDFAHDRNGYKTRFLRTKPELAKISWINDVEREKDIDHAAETLLDLGLTREQQVWSKKIELSLGKLALLAEEEEHEKQQAAAGRPAKADGMNLEKVDQALELINIQDALYQQILPTIQDAVDEPAEIEFAVKEHGGLIPKRQKALLTLFEDSMARLLRHEALQPHTLIDLLTLAELPESSYESLGDQFCVALKVARYGLSGQEREDAEKLIWRRCFIRDDWKDINVTNDKLDVDQLETVGKTSAYRTLFAIADEGEFCFLSDT